MGSHSLLQGIFLTQGSNLGLPHCRQVLYCLSRQGVPYSAIDILVMSSLLPYTSYQNALQIYVNLIPVSYEMLLLCSCNYYCRTPYISFLLLLCVLNEVPPFS